MPKTSDLPSTLIRRCLRPYSLPRRLLTAASPIFTCRRNELRLVPGQTLIARCCAMTDPFIAHVTPPESLSEPAHWYIFQGTQLLVYRGEGRAQVPALLDPGELGLQPLRSQYLGVLDNR